jgi:hypothetical protein
MEPIPAAAAATADGGGDSDSGGAGGATNDALTNSVYPGSAGGGDDGVGGGAGGSGGGYISIQASGALIVDGTVKANGQSKATGEGGGSGGGIYLSCASLSGGGAIQADGGSGGSQGGGGGGRIAIYGAGAGFSGTISVTRGAGRTVFPDLTGSYVGTIYLSDWSLLPGTLQDGGEGRFTAPPGTRGDLTITNYTMFMDAGWTNNALQAGAVLIRNGGKLKHWRNSDTAAPWAPDAGIFLECTTLTVDTNGEINADYVGYGGGNQVSGYGPGKGTHGTYTGGGGDANSPQGGAGGGYIRILAAGMVTINGTITANGGLGYSGGSGGGIYLDCLNLFGAGTIRANGGNASGNHGGGGGGRIAVYFRGAPYYTSGILFPLTAARGTGYGSGGTTGTVYRFFKPQGTKFSTW